MFGRRRDRSRPSASKIRMAVSASFHWIALEELQLSPNCSTLSHSSCSFAAAGRQSTRGIEHLQREETLPPLLRAGRPRGIRQSWKITSGSLARVPSLFSFLPRCIPGVPHVGERRRPRCRDCPCRSPRNDNHHAADAPVSDEVVPAPFIRQPAPSRAAGLRRPRRCRSGSICPPRRAPPRQPAAAGIHRRFSAPHCKHCEYGTSRRNQGNHGQDTRAQTFVRSNRHQHAEPPNCSAN